MDETKPREIGPYRLDVLLGRGGMGEVYKAWDQRLERWVAVKHLLGGGFLGHAPQEGARARFRREARTAAGLGHPGIVQVFDILEEGGDDWIVMELIDGPNLADLLRDGPLDVGLAVDYARQIASGLATAHGAGIVHRDLKTENVMVLPSGYVKILDFGLAKRGAGAEDTVSGHFGTPRAMSPEQLTGGTVDGRSDLFALGVLLYELLTARSPFSGNTPYDTIYRVATHQQPPVLSFDPRIPQELSDVVDELLAKDPDLRPQGAGAAAEALERVATGNPRLAISPADSVLPPTDDEAVIRTLVVSELVGLVKLLERPGDEAAAALRHRHDPLVKDLLVRHDGVEIDKVDVRTVALERNQGLHLFQRPSDAIGYALAYHAALHRLSPESGVTLAARVGIHLGEVILLRNSPEDVARGARLFEVTGLARPTAVRLLSLAAAEQTLLSCSAYDVARRASAQELADVRWLAHGLYRFEGLEDDVEIFEVGVRSSARRSAPRDSGVARRVDLSPSPLWEPAGSGGVGVRVSGLRRRPEEKRPSAAPHPSPLPKGEGVRRTEPSALVLRTWPPPELPEHPYPVLLPYTHPALLAGREQEIEEIRMELRAPVPIFGLGGASGLGKSSLLLGGLVPALRAGGGASPVALDRHPHEAGLAERLLGDLLEHPGVRAEAGAGVEVDDGDWRAFLGRLAEVERLAGAAPLLVLDQFEDVLRGEDRAARARLGVLLAATAQRRPGMDEPLCRWLLAYRQEYHGEVLAWLDDVLVEAKAQDVPAAGIEVLPYRLSGPERFRSLTIEPLATPPAGAGDALAAATQVFRTAIEKPLAQPDADARPRYPWRFAPGHAERLARSFAEARRARPEAPLVPELQVVLAHLLAAADADGLVTVPDDPGELVEEALADHLRRALEEAFPAAADEAAPGTAAIGSAAVGRAKALLALRELATATGQRDLGLPAEDLARALGEDGHRVLEELATPLARLVVLRDSPEGLRYVLSHDRMAEVVVRMVEEEGRHGKLTVDAELLALRRFVALKTALYASSSGDAGVASRIPRPHFRRIADHAEALLWDDERRGWWRACRERRRADRGRATALAAAALLFLALVSWGTWSSVGRSSQRQALRDQVVAGDPGAALQALERLTEAAGTEAAGTEELLALLRRRQEAMDVVSRGLGGILEEERAAVVLRTVELALPWVAETPDDPVLIANLTWALDYSPLRDPELRRPARALRDRVLEPLRALRPPPAIAGDDPDWVAVPAGTFRMGSPAGEGDEDEHPRHEVEVSAFRILRREVTNAELRRLFPDAAGDDHMPAAYLTWYEAYTYAAWLGGRLPTETEWEYAARAGCPYAHCARDGREVTVDEVAWTSGNSRDPDTGTSAPSPGMRREPNPWGICDIFGNFYEWTSDWYAAYPDGPGPRKDPWGPPDSSDGRVNRGGGFRNPPTGARAADRNRLVPLNEYDNQGCRVVLPAGGLPEAP